MKETNVPWIGKIPQEWELVRVKDVSPVNRGASPRPIDDEIYFDDQGEYAWVRISDVSASVGFLESTTQRLSKLGEAKSVKRQPGDLFLSIAGTVGKACITNIKACIHDGFVYFPRMNDRTTKSFFFYLFNSGLAYDGLGKLGTQLNLNTETVGSILVPLPPITEQAVINDYILRLTTWIDKRRELLTKKRELLGELRRSMIHESVTGKIDLSTAGLPSLRPIVAREMKASCVNWIGALPATWELKRFKNAGSFQTGKDHKSLSVGSVPVFGSSSEPFAWVDRPLCSRKAIAIGRKGTIDRPFVIQPGFWAVDTCMFHTVQRTDFSLDYLGYWSNIVPWKEISTQTALPSLTQTDANNVIAAYPPVDEQHRIADFLDHRLSKIARQITLIDQLDDLLKQQRKAIIHEAVTGKIDLSGAALG